MDHNVPTLHLYPLSANAHSVWLLLKAAGIEHKINNVDIMKGDQMKPEFLAKFPLHHIPAFEDGDVCLGEGPAILRYICFRWPEKTQKYLPLNPKDRALTEFAMDWRHTEFYRSMTPVVYPHLGIGNQSKEEQDASFETFKIQLGHLENLFLKDRKFIGGDKPSIGDLAVATVFPFFEVSVLREDGGIKLSDRLQKYRDDFSEAFPQWQEIVDSGAELKYGIKMYIAQQIVKEKEKK